MKTNRLFRTLLCLALLLMLPLTAAVDEGFAAISRGGITEHGALGANATTNIGAAIVALGGGSVAGASLTPTVDGTNVYGNGTPLYISEEMNTTYVCTGGYYGDTGYQATVASWVSQTKEQPKVFGGCKSGTLTVDTAVYMKSGRVHIIYGGNEGADGSVATLNGSTEIRVSGGTLNGGVFGGGGRSTANVTGNVTIAISGNANVGWVCGTGNSPIGGNSTITISGGTIDDDICGGGYLMNGTIGGSSSVTISGGTIKRNVIGGGYSGGNTVGGSSSVTISGGAITGADYYIIGGGYAGGTTVGASGQGNTAKVTITGGTVDAKVYGQYDYSPVNGNVEVTLSGGTVRNEIRGAHTAANVTGSVAVRVSGGFATSGNGIIILNSTKNSPVDIAGALNGGATQSVKLQYDGTPGASTVVAHAAASENADKAKFSLVDNSGKAYFLEAQADTAGGSNIVVKAQVPDLTGTVSINGTLKFGQELTAALSSDSNNTGTLSYQWKRGGETGTDIGTGAKYTLTADDIGKTIFCVITSSVQTGSVSGSTSAAIGKADGPAAPTELEGTAPYNVIGTNGSIGELNINKLYEYTTTPNDSTSWISVVDYSERIVNLTSGRYYVRIKGTTTHAPGASAEVIVPACRPIYLNAPGALVWGGATATTISWGQVPEASSYKLQLYKNGKADAVSNEIHVTTRSYSVDMDSLIGSHGRGLYYFKVKAVDDNGNYGDSAWSVSDTYATPDKPKITKQPENQYVIAGQSAYFTMSYSSNPAPEARWQISIDGGANWADIAGADDPIYSIGATELSQNGYQYRYILSNRFGSEISQAATLTVLRSVQVGELMLPDGQYTTDGKNVAAVTPTDNYAYFSTAGGTATLTLKNFDYTGLGIADSNGIIKASENLTLSLEGVSTVTGTGEIVTNASTPAVYVEGGSLTVTGNGTLNAKGAAQSHGVYVTGDLTMNGGTLVATAGDAVGTSGQSGVDCTGKIVVNNGELRGVGPVGDMAAESRGVFAGGDITVNGGKLAGEGKNAVEGSVGILSDTGKITVVNGVVEATAGNASDNVCRSSAIYCHGVKVEGGTVTATAGDVTGSVGKSFAITGHVAPVIISGGTVNATAGNATGQGGKSIAIHAVEECITISGGTVNATAKDATGSSGESTAICATYSVSITGGTVNATGGNANDESGESYGIRCLSGNIPVSGGTVTAISGTASHGFAISGRNSGPDLSGYVNCYATAAANASGTPRVMYDPNFIRYKYVRLEQGYPVSGTVTDKDTGAGLEYASVQLKQGTANVGDAFLTGVTGAYRLCAPIDTGYTVEASKGGYTTVATASFSLTAAGATDKNIALTKITITFTTQPQNTAVTHGFISGSLTAAAQVQDGTAASLDWYECSASGAIIGTSLCSTGTFAIPANLTVGDHYYLCRATSPGAETTDSDVATVSVVPVTPLNVGISPSSTITQGGADETVITVGEGVSSFGMGNFDAANGGVQMSYENGPFVNLTQRSECDVTEGSIKVTLHKAYLNTLATGRYTLRVRLTGVGYPAYVETTLTVVKNVAPPKTGDSAAPWLWLLMCLLGGAGLLGAIKRLRKA